MKTDQHSARELLAGNIQKDECAPFYHSYTKLSTGADLFKRFQDGKKKILEITEKLTEKEAHYRYADDKWSIKEVIGHLTDTERIMVYRALSFARNEQAELPGYDHNAYVAEANFDEVSLERLIKDNHIVRDSTVSLFRSFTPKMLMRDGVANNCRFTVRALGFIIAGHELHHLNIIREKYLNKSI